MDPLLHPATNAGSGVISSPDGTFDRIRGSRLFQTYTLSNFRRISQMERVPESAKFDIEVVGRVLPFKANNYVVEELIDWARYDEDPVFHLTFPQRDVLRPDHYEEMATLLRRGAAEAEITEAANRIRMQLNPHPAGQLEHNVPIINGAPFYGVQHKYRETILYFPNQGQTCHAYCTFCFRWPQFVGLRDLKLGSREVDLLIAYLREHPEVDDLLFTGGDPMVMSASRLAAYIDPLLEANLPGLRRIRIGTKALSYWPQRFVGDADSADLLALFRKVVDHGWHLALMAHFNHGREMATPLCEEAIRRIRDTGAEIRTQTPILRHINDDPTALADMWNRQVDLGCIPYYAFVPRDTGAQHYFALPLARIWEIFRAAYSQVSGLARTVRGPSMSTTPGKIQIVGITEAAGEKVFVMRFLQGRDPGWVHRPFFAAYDENATWLDELRPAFGQEKFFFEDELEHVFHDTLEASTADHFE